jgi:hypothetical protein
MFCIIKISGIEMFAPKIDFLISNALVEHKVLFNIYLCINKYYFDTNLLMESPYL